MTHQHLTNELRGTNGLRGDVLLPDDDGYADAATTFFASGKPALVVRPRDAAGVASAIRYAQREGLALSVRSGGHGLLGAATNDGGLVLDLAHLDSVELLAPDAADPDNTHPDRTLVRVDAGACWGHVMRTLDPHGLGLTAGDTAGVGVGGLTLGGGIGWLVRKHGLAIDHLMAARVVTADGRVLQATADAHADLFWAIRGGGGNFGVVVSFDFVAEPVPLVHFGTLTYRADDPARLVAAWRDHMRTAPESLTSTLALMPPMFGAPASATVTLCYADDAAGPLRSVGPLRAIGEVLADDVRVMRYADVLATAHRPPGGRLLSRNALVPRLDDDVMAAAVAVHRGGSATVLRSLGGAFGRVPAEATAFAHRDAEAMIVCAAFLPEDATAADEETALAAWPDVARHGTGVYLNFQGSDTPADVATAYPPQTYARLAAAKRRYDPGNVFGRGHNIPPAHI
ncbi:FAD-binding oxidoreductase [Promicromonospora sp. NPDC050249]|uniref:FAD-binding oxidoreductase n=1 Tax=Promicromonospora sp. NPDC050249 TaxID=3154743 RepID=UPI0033D0225E